MGHRILAFGDQFLVRCTHLALWIVIIQNITRSHPHGAIWRKLWIALPRWAPRPTSREFARYFPDRELARRGHELRVVRSRDDGETRFCSWIVQTVCLQKCDDQRAGLNLWRQIYPNGIASCYSRSSCSSSIACGCRTKALVGRASRHATRARSCASADSSDGVTTPTPRKRRSSWRRTPATRISSCHS